MEAQQKQQQELQPDQQKRITRDEYVQIQKLNSLSNQVSQQSLRIADLEAQLSLANAEFQQINSQMEELTKENNELKSKLGELPGESKPEELADKKEAKAH